MTKLKHPFFTKQDYKSKFKEPSMKNHTQFVTFKEIPQIKLYFELNLLTGSVRFFELLSKTLVKHEDGWTARVKYAFTFVPTPSRFTAILHRFINGMAEETAVEDFASDLEDITGIDRTGNPIYK